LQYSDNGITRRRSIAPADVSHHADPETGGAMRENAQFVILEWIAEPSEFPRYSFATVKHAEELRPNVRWLETRSSLEAAAEAVTELNLREGSRQTVG
jgi:hypothetical protein